MYIPAAQACNVQNSASPISAAKIAADAAETARQDAALNRANRSWASVIGRDWQSFQEMGPQVAVQLRNNTAIPGGGVPGVRTPAGNITTAARVVDHPSGNPAASNSGSGAAAIVTGIADGTTTTRSDAQFVQQFGVSPTGPAKPRGEDGSVAYLRYGGSSSPLAVGAGRTQARTPDPRRGYAPPSGSCATGTPAHALSVGEPDYWAGVPVDSLAPASGAGLAIAAVLGLAALALLFDGDDSKKGRG